MNNCIKCGRQIPEGELFCVECSMNPGSSLFEEPRPAPVGRMQSPAPRKPAPRPVAVATPERKTKKSKGGQRVQKPQNGGLKAAFAIVCILLVLVVGFLIWQYADIKVERTRLETKEADLLLREKEKEELQLQIEELEQEIEDLNETIEEKEAEIKELRTQLSGSQSSQSQSEYDLSTIQMEIERLEEENKQLLLLEEEKEAEIKRLNGEVASMTGYQEKAVFMDKFVVFANNDNSKLYHTYDCERFTKKDFWAYSRKLAESNGFSPCPTCQGKAQ